MFVDGYYCIHILISSVQSPMVACLLQRTYLLLLPFIVSIYSNVRFTAAGSIDIGSLTELVHAMPCKIIVL